MASALIFRGGWSAAGGAYPTPSMNPETSDYYRITVGGTMTGAQGNITVTAGDYLHWDMTLDQWFKIDAVDAVTSVAGRTGDVTLTKTDVGLANVPNTDATNASNITSGTLAAARLPASINAATTGNAATATKLATARTINGVLFDGSVDITIADSTKLPSVGGNLDGGINFTPDSGVVLAFDGTPAIQRFAGANSKSMGIGADDTLFLGAGESVATMTTNITAGAEDVHIGAETNVFIHVSPDNWASWATKKTFSIDATNGPMWAGGKVWNAGNDGSGSGLDADLLDGKDGAYYRDASNINAGTIGDAYIPATISSSITGNAATASTLQTARTINSVSFNGSANITVEPYIETDSSSASRYLTFVDSVTAGYQRLNMDSGLTYNPSTNVLSATVTSDINEVGKVVAFAKSSAPSGFLKCNGAAVSRTTYAALYAAIGTTFGSGDGSTTFNVPDLRGEFVRGWDDARGIDSGRTFGSWQDGQNVSHTHTGTTSSDSHTHTHSGTT